MTDYILHKFMCQSIWVLNNATWLDANEIQIGDGVTGGDAYREVEDTYNRNWEFKILVSCKNYEGDPLGFETSIFLEDDDKPIIFRHQFNIGAENRTWFIIYDGDIKDQVTVEGIPWWPQINIYPMNTIWRVGSVYYYFGIIGYVLSFDYSLIKKPVKVGFTQTGDTKTSRWHYPDWYYTEPLGDVYIF